MSTKHEYDRLFAYMRRGIPQNIATLAAWGWLSFTREHNALAVQAAQAWGRAADAILAALDNLDQAAAA